ncbi:membrane integrity-associated transporter subunit PqiC [Mailhella massiliensis]|uniref:PqiC family protein n=1 Tax=Mailhella massiliensis TaxID=1903261 RepID=A0A921AXQ8_9BACT|nr:PqiC family protein [Mailhella massiliensis]HJD98063.1 PqiC family protein [Mailhella massiliensis]
MKALFSALALSALLAGCTLPSQSFPEVRYYVLTPLAPSAPAPSVTAPGAPDIGVIPVMLPGYLTRPQIVLREKDGVNLDIHEFDRWGEALSMGISRVMCDNFSARGVSAVSLRTGTKVDKKLMLDVRRFDGPLGGDVVLDVVWTLQKDGEVLMSGHVLKSRAAGDSLKTMVDAQSLLLRDFADELAPKLR